MPCFYCYLFQGPNRTGYRETILQSSRLVLHHGMLINGMRIHGRSWTGYVLGKAQDFVAEQLRKRKIRRVPFPFIQRELGTRGQVLMLYRLTVVGTASSCSSEQFYVNVQVLASHHAAERNYRSDLRSAEDHRPQIIMVTPYRPKIVDHHALSLSHPATT